MRLQARTQYPAILAIAYLVVTGVWFAFPALRSREFLVSGIGGVSALGFFLYSRHLEQAKFFKELFVAFNARYDALNDELARINASTVDEGEPTLIDYFNLCAEEYFFYKAGYIDETVWRSWCDGMKQYAANRRIRDMWERELQSQSYYGFTIPE